MIPWTLLRTRLRSLFPAHNARVRDQIVERWTQQLNEWKAQQKLHRHVTYSNR